MPSRTTRKAGALFRLPLVSRLQRASSISAEQVGAVRKRWLIERLKNGSAKGTFWGIDARYEDYHLDGAKGFTGDARDYFHKSARTWTPLRKEKWIVWRIMDTHWRMLRCGHLAKASAQMQMLNFSGRAMADATIRQ